MKPSTVLILGVKGHVVCIRKSDGVELWRTHLRGSAVTSVCCDGDQIFAATKGYLYALDLGSGKIQWVNGLKKLGFGMCLMGTPNQSTMAALNVIAQQQAAAMAAAAAASSASAAASSGS